VKIRKRLKTLKGDFLDFSSNHSTMLYIPPLRVHCERGCWFESRFVATFALAVRSSNPSARSQPLTEEILPNMDDTQSLSFDL
jgi:hypothetical protein